MGGKGTLSTILLISILSAQATVRADVPRVHSVTPSCGSTNGGTRITIYGRGFAADYFNYGKGNENLGSRVQLVNINSFECEIHADGSHETQIMCYTLPMPADTYDVKVSVNGVAVPSDRYCKDEYSCKFKALRSCTPTIDHVSPFSGMPGSFLTMKGDIKTGLYGANEGNENEPLILRTYYGGQKCELRDTETDTMYGISLEKGEIKCKAEGTFVGNLDVSYLVSGTFGRSQPNPKTKHVRRIGASMYQAFTEISYISQSQGSTMGGTRLTITGQHFDETNSPAKVFIGGQECEIIEPITDTTIVCMTPPDSSVGISDFTGGRGLYSYIQYDGKNLNSFTYKNANVTHVDSSSWKGSFKSPYLQRMPGYFVPFESSNYTFYLDSDGSSNFFLSPDSDRKRKIKMSSGGPPVSLKADTPYYMEINHVSRNKDKYVKLKARQDKTDLSEEDTGMAEHEIQDIKFTSEVSKEIQVIDVVATGTAGAVQADVQTINIDGNPSAYFAIGLDGIYTVPLQLSMLSNGAVVQEELEKLPNIDFDVAVQIERTGNSITLVITSKSSQGEISDYRCKVVGGAESDLTFSLERTVLGKPNLKTFTLTMDGQPTSPIAVRASASKVKSVLEKLFAVQCHPKLNEGSVFDFETKGALWTSGRVSDAEPFCGRYSLKNPKYIYRKGRGQNDFGIAVSSNENRFMCFAYKGPGEVRSLLISLAYTDENDNVKSSTVRFGVKNDYPTMWRYHCEDIFDLILSKITGFGIFVEDIQVQKLYDDEDLFIDQVIFNKKPPLDDAVKDGIYNMRRPQVQPNGYFMNKISVTAPSSTQYQIEFSPHHCGFDMPMFQVAGAKASGPEYTISNGGKLTVNINRKQRASPPIGGFFRVKFKGSMSPSPIPVTTEIDNDNIVANLASMSVGFSAVSGSGTCSVFKYRVKMVSQTGDQPQMEIDSSQLTGSNVQVTVSTVQDGGVWLDPIMGDLLRTHHRTPQVLAFINDIPTRCSSPTDCTFEWSSDFTPTVSDISPSSGSHGDVVSITGTGFDDSDLKNNEVVIGTTPCTVTFVDSTSIKCTLNNGATGVATVKVYVAGKGLAETTVKFTYLTGVNSFTPTSGSVGGGTLLTIDGYGFTSDAVVTLADKECTIKNISESQITCKTPQAASELNEADVDVVITQLGSEIEAGKFTYKPTLTHTPVVTAISRTAGNVWGGESLTIDGQGFGDTEMPVTLGGAYLSVSSYTDNQIVGTLPALPHGSYKLLIDVENKGYADLRTNSISDITSSFQVSSMAPGIGSLYGGTDILIAGEGFSTDKSHFDIKIGSHPCDIETVSSTKIKCRIAHSGIHHSISSDGTHKYYGVGYAWNKDPYTVNVGDYVTWTWDTPFYVNDIVYGVHQTETAGDMKNMEGGFSSGPNTRTGSFTHRFTRAGVYYYWTGFMDSDHVVYFRGTITVTSLVSHVGSLSVLMHGIEASYNTAGSRVLDNANCPASFSHLTDCSDPTILTKDPTKFNFEFRKCFSPYIDGISGTNGTTDDIITLMGDGFGSMDCQNEISFDESTCTTVRSSPSSVDFKISDEDSPSPKVPHQFELRVANLGYALTTIAEERKQSFELLPWIESIKPSEGSKMGGTKVTISGSGFVGGVDNILVRWKYLSCLVEEVSYKQIVCETQCGSTPDNCFVGSMQGQIAIGNTFAKCLDSICNFTTVAEKTASVTGLTPDTVSKATTEITISGMGFGTLAADLKVKIGGEDCVVFGMVSDTSFTCTVGRLPVGDNRVDVYVGNNGKAMTTLTVLSQKEASLTSPLESSTYGGATLTLSGNGFVDGDTSVTVGGKECLVISTTFEKVTCTLPANTVGDHSVIVTSKGIQYESISLSYSSAATPHVISISPSEGQSGNTVEITGNGFKPSSSNPHVTIGGVECTVQSASETSITCIAGIKETGVFAVHVFVPERGYSNNDVVYTYKVGPFSVSPITGSTNGGQVITLEGSGFLENDTVVTVCGERCREISLSESKYICSTPPAPDLSTSKDCDVVVTVAGVTQKETKAYSYDPSLVNTITSVSPSRAGTGGGTMITIKGTNFGSSTDDIRVTIADVPCIVQSVDDTEIKCRTGAAHSTDTLVSVQRKDGGEAVQENAAFEYIDLWSNPYTWGGDAPPSDGEFVIIPAGQKILLDIDTGVLKMLLIQGGEVIFDEKDIELQAENILITDGGLLQVGSEENPFPRDKKAIITLHGHLRSKELPIYGTKSLAVREGTLNLYGSKVTHTWTRLRKTAAAKSSMLELEHSVDWQVGDEIVVATTGASNSQRESEVRVISAISPDGHTLTLESALTYEHLGITGTFGSTTVEFRAEVGLLTRNVVVRGNRNTEFDSTIEPCPDTFKTGEFATQTCFQGKFGEELGSDQFGAQIMVHQPKNMRQIAQAHLEYVELTHVGQAFRLGRYPVHLHLNGDMSKSFVRGCAIHRSFNRAVNVHGSHNVLVEKNVIYNVMGGGFFLEDGDETGNIFQYNLAIFVRASTSLRNDDVTPAGFWATNPNNIIRHNAVAGGTHFGTWYRMREHPEGPGFDSKICPQAVPLGEYRNNTAHSLGSFGLWIFTRYVPRKEASCASSASHKVAKFYSLTAWNCQKGAEGVQIGAVQFHNFVLVNNELAGYEGKLIASNPPQFDSENGPGIFNSVIAAHYDKNLRGRPTFGGIILPYYSGFLIENVEFHNFNKAKSATLRWTRIAGKCPVFCGGFRTDTAGLAFINSPNGVAFAWQSEGVLHDRDGSLTGNAGYSVAACTPSFDNGRCTPNTLMSVDKPGCVCTDEIKLIRFSFNGISPDSLNYKRAILTNEFGSTSSPWSDKRITHPVGWSFVIMANHYYNFSFANADHISNISYKSTFYDFDDSDFVVFSQSANEKPDQLMLDGKTPLEMSDSQLSGSEVHYGDWFYSVPNRLLSYAVSRSGQSKLKDELTNSRDININFKARRCLYRGCKRPKSPSKLTDEPSHKQKWSDASTWIDVTADDLEPKAMADVTIPKDKWIIVDKTIPPLGKLVIAGGLQFEKNSTRDIILEADSIYITGRLVVGWSDKDPYLGKVVIRLRGSHSTPAYPVKFGPTLGSKFIAVFGGLQLHGMDRGITKTFLASTVLPGSNSITVRDKVNWMADDEILISTTDYNAWNTEVFKIIDITDNTITLNDTIKHRHIAHEENVNGKIIELSASVALLTRSIRIEGEEYPEMEKESFGARVVVGQTSDDDGRHSGFAQVSNVEFYHTGQEGYSDNYDARFSLTYFDVTTSHKSLRYSYVKKSTFHSGYNTAIGVFGTNDLSINGNVIYHTVGAGIRTESVATKITNNLVALSIWPGAYQNRTEGMNAEFDGAIHARKAKQLVLANNIVAGSERAGYRLPGQACKTTDNTLWTNNMAHSCLTGVVMFAGDPAADQKCILLHGFTAWKNYDFGIYYSNIPSVEIRNNVIVENGVGLFPFVIGPFATSHKYEDKSVKIKNNVIIGKTSSFSESEDNRTTKDDNLKLSWQARGFGSSVTCGKIGLVMGTFSSTTNMAPKKSFTGIKSYPSIKGLTQVTGNTFVNFGSCTGGHDHAIATNKNNDDGIHPLQISDTTLVNVEPAAKVLFHSPSLGKINPTDCVDMDCDGLKKCMVRDLDGTFIGSKGTVLPNSAYEWNGDPQRGLGDYRIPTALLTTRSGKKIDVEGYAPNKGIFKTDSCTWITEWNAYSCGSEYEWRMLIIESMDSDSETRRISPVAIYHPDGYVDLINGPQDHGWCGGYTCRKRLSTFQAIVALDEPFNIYLTGNNPKVMRYMLLNSDPNECVLMGMWYSTIHRLEVSVDGKVMLPTNGYITKSGAFRLRMPETDDEFIPKVEDKINGQYYLSLEDQMIHWVQCGGSEIKVSMKDVLVVSFTLPAMTEEEFFGERIIENLAAFLRIDPNKVRIVNIVKDTSSSGRQRREIGTVTFYVEIGDNPGKPDTLDYKEIGQQIINKIQLGDIDEIINGTVLKSAILEPDDSTSGDLVPVEKIAELILDTQPVGNSAESEELHVQPKLKVTDNNGDVLTYLGSITSTWEIEVIIKSGDNAEAKLVGDTRIDFTGGWANFTNLAITHKGSYILEFHIAAPRDAAKFSLTSVAVMVSGRNIGPKANIKTTSRVTRSPLEFEVSFIDRDSDTDITDIDWAGHTWTASATIFEPEIYPGTIDGPMTATFDPDTGKATFRDLLLSKPGKCAILVTIKSNLNDYELKMVVYIDVMTREQADMIVAEDHSLELKFPITFDADRAHVWTTQVRNHYSDFSDMRIVGDSYRSGSLIVTLNIEATLSGYNEMLHHLCSDIENGRNFTFDDQTVAMSGYLSVDGTSSYEVACGKVIEKECSDGPDSKYIIIISVLSAIIFILFTALLIYKFCCRPNYSDNDRRQLFHRTNYFTDDLSREATFNSLKSHNNPTPIPPLSTRKSFEVNMSSPSPSPSARLRNGGKVSPEPSSRNLSPAPPSRMPETLMDV